MNSFQNKRRRLAENEYEEGGQAFLAVPASGFFNNQSQPNNNRNMEKMMNELANLANQVNTQNILIQELHRKLQECQEEILSLKNGSKRDRWESVPSYIN